MIDFQKQMQFLMEIDKLKTITRRSLLLNGERRENDAEHSWHISMMALVLYPHADAKKLDVLKAVTMTLIHDIVEIDAGDFYLYDSNLQDEKEKKEKAAADRLFGMLPNDQNKHFRSLWDEFEAGKTAEAKFARALDRMLPILQNYFTHGQSWKEHNITYRQVIEKAEIIKKSSALLYDFIVEILNDAVEKGYLAESH